MDTNNQAWTLRKFVRQIGKVTQLIDDYPDQFDLTVRISMHKDEGTQAVFVDGDSEPKVRFAVLMRPIANARSELALATVWSLMKNHLSLDPTFSDNVDQAIRQASEGTIPVTLNGEHIAANQLYAALADGQYFAADDAASRLRAALSFGPGGPMLFMHFFSYCMRLYEISAALVEQIVLRIPAPTNIDDVKCIYCLGTDGSFTSEEHAIPEAFGNDDAVLPRGQVCDECNNTLSTLDQWLADFEAIAFQRVIHTPHTKKGKLPRADFGNVRIEKTKPRVIRIVEKSGERSLIHSGSNHSDLLSFTLNLKGRRPLDPQMLGRSLYKIGLAMIAFQAGPEIACDPRYDAARAFIRGERSFENYLVVPKLAKPADAIRTAFYNDSERGGTFFMIDFWGIQFAFNLELKPQITLPSDFNLAQEFGTIFLGDDPDDKPGNRS